MGHKDSSTVVELEVIGQDIAGLQTILKGIAAAAFYGICSVSSAFVTKALLDTMKFDFPVMVMVVQMIFTIIILEGLRFADVIDLPRYTIKRGLSFLWPAVFYGLNAVFSLSALAHMNIAMYGVLKRCVPISTMVFSTFILNQGCPSRVIMLTVFMLSMGCVIAGFGDLTFNFTAYLCGIISNFTQALYLLLVQRHAQHHKMSTTETLHLNCHNSLPILLLFALVNGEFSHVRNYPVNQHPMFFLVFGTTIGVGILLNYSLFLCTGLTSALTTSVVGGLKAMVQTLLGLFTFGGVSHNVPTYVGISLNLLGGIGYIAAKYQENRTVHKDLHKVMSLPSFTAKGFFKGKDQEEASEDNTSCSLESRNGECVKEREVIKAMKSHSITD